MCQFITSEITNTLPLDTVVNAAQTRHMANDRRARLNAYISANGNAETIATFIVDRGCVQGLELHNITAQGFDFVLNMGKFENGSPCFITALALRPAQVRNLYHMANQYAPKSLLDNCLNNQKCNLCQM